jgi:hypothetical protein
VDDLVVVVDQLAEAEHVAVERDELVHLAKSHVPDAVIDFEQVEALGCASRTPDASETGREDPAVRAAIHERVKRLPVRSDRRLAQHAVLAAVELGRRQGRGRSTRGRLAPGRFDVIHRERDVVDAVAVLADVLGDLAVGRQRRREDEPDVVLDHDVARPIAHLRLQATERDRREPPQRPVVGARLASVANPEFDVINALERQEVLRLGVGILVDPGAGLVGGTLGEGLGHRATSRAGCAGLRAGPGRHADGSVRAHSWLPMLRRHVKLAA